MPVQMSIEDSPTSLVASKRLILRLHSFRRRAKILPVLAERMQFDGQLMGLPSLGCQIAISWPVHVVGFIRDGL